MSNDRRQVGKIPLQRKLVPKHDVPQEAPVEVAREAPVDVRREAPEDAPQELPQEAPPGAPAIDLAEVTIDLSHLEVVPREVAEALRILPLLVSGDGIVLAMADPQDRRAIDEIEFVTGKTVLPRAASEAGLRKALAAAYDARARGEKHYAGPRASR
jgi:hypothetical protein